MLKSAPDTEYLKNRFINEEKKIEIGIYPVLFGWRIHAGIINSGVYELDYCAGDKKEFVEQILSLVKAILEKHDYNWRVFPRQKVKPMFNDMPCFLKLIELAGTDYEKLTVPDLTILRHEIMSKIFNL